MTKVIFSLIRKFINKIKHRKIFLPAIRSGKSFLMELLRITIPCALTAYFLIHPFEVSRGPAHLATVPYLFFEMFFLVLPHASHVVIMIPLL
jgi:hypothetical protein